MSTRKKQAPPQTITIDSRQLLARLAVAVRYCSQPDLPPVLAAVRFIEVDGYLHLLATDRYRAVLMRTDANAPAGFDHNLPLGDAKLVRQIFNGARMRYSQVVITADGDDLTVSSEGAGGAPSVSLSVQQPLMDEKKPNLLKLFREARTDPNTGRGVNSRYLADLDGIATKGTAVVTYQSGPKLIAVGDLGVALIMTLRSESDSGKVADWSGLLHADAATAAEKAVA